MHHLQGQRQAIHMQMLSRRPKIEDHRPTLRATHQSGTQKLSVRHLQGNLLNLNQSSILGNRYHCSMTERRHHIRI